VFDEQPLARPWPRFWARLLDVTLYGLPVAVLLGLIFPSFFQSETFAGPGGEYLAGFIVLPFALATDAIILSMTGSSPGKALAGLYVATTNDEKVPLAVSLQRSASIYVQGLILGIPLLVLFGYIAAHNDVKDEGTTGWDRLTETRVYAGANDVGRTIIVGIAALIAIAVSNALAKAG
jgi:uncharacterized RDD family membrane protein YckC